MRRGAFSLAVLVPFLAACGGPGAGGPDCAGLTIEAVRDAATRVDGYTFEIEGTQRVARIGRTAFSYSDAPVVASGAYDAPDAGRIEFTTGAVPERPLLSPLLAFWTPGVDGIVRVGDAAWSRPSGEVEYVVSEGNLSPVPNTLVPLLSGQPFALEAIGVPQQQGASVDLDWRPGSEPCVLVGALPDDAIAVQVEVAPGTVLPRRVTSTADIEAAAGNPTRTWDITYLFDYDTFPRIVPPGEPEGR